MTGRGNAPLTEVPDNPEPTTPLYIYCLAAVTMLCAITVVIATSVFWFPGTPSTGTPEDGDPAMDATPTTLPEKTTPSTLPENTTPSTLPENTTPSTLPENTTPTTLPDETTPTTLPENTTPTTLPDETTSTTLPENTTPTTLPNETYPTTLPEKTTPTILPEKTTPTTLPENTTPTTLPDETTPITLPTVCKRSVPFSVKKCDKTNIGYTVFDHVAGECRNRTTTALCFTSGAMHSEAECAMCETSASAACTTPPQIGNCTAKEIRPDNWYWHWHTEKGVCVQWDFRGGKCLSVDALGTGVHTTEEGCKTHCRPTPGFSGELHPCAKNLNISLDKVVECTRHGDRMDSWNFLGGLCIGVSRICFAGPYVFESYADCNRTCS